MRITGLIAATLICASAISASEIREFDLKTIERLGNELTTVSQARGRGATTPERKQAVKTAKAALEGKLFNIRYDYVVLDDPDGSGFLIYALATSTNADEVLTGGHYRITVSADGSRAERVDLLSQLIRVKADPGGKTVGVGASQLSSDVPVETWLYSSYLYHMPMYVATKDGSTWRIVNGKIHKFTKAEIAAMEKEKKNK